MSFTLRLDMLNAVDAAICVDSMELNAMFFVNPAEVVFCPIPVIQTGSSVNFLHVFSEASNIDAPPVHGLEQSSNLRSSVNFLEFITSSEEYVFSESAFGLFLDCL